MFRSSKKRLRAVAFTTTVAALLLVVLHAEPSGAVSNTTCQGDIALIRVRGSGDQRAVDAELNRAGQLGNFGFGHYGASDKHQLTLDSVAKAFRSRAAAAGKTVNEYDLAYTASAIGDVLKVQFSVSVAGGLSSINANSTYLASIQQGKDNLTTVLNVKRACTSQKLVVIGYSQGALVAGDVLASLSQGDKNRISAAALFGDPRFDPADSAAQRRGSYDPTRYGVDYLHGKRQVGGGFGGRIGNFCYSDDLVCQGLNPFVRDAVPYPSLWSQATTVFNGQKNAHARGYSCNALTSDVDCQHYVDSGGASLGRSAGGWLADVVGLQAPPPTTTTAASTTTITFPTQPTFTVMNTSEAPPDGVWFRNSPHTADTERITGLGAYMNEQIQAQCYAFGDAVGPYANALWYRGVNVTRPTVGARPNSGYINTHYVNDGMVANQPAPGIAPC